MTKSPKSPSKLEPSRSPSRRKKGSSSSAQAGTIANGLAKLAAEREQRWVETNGEHQYHLKDLKKEFLEELADALNYVERSKLGAWPKRGIRGVLEDLYWFVGTLDWEKGDSDVDR